MKDREALPSNVDHYNSGDCWLDFGLLEMVKVSWINYSGYEILFTIFFSSSIAWICYNYFSHLRLLLVKVYLAVFMTAWMILYGFSFNRPLDNYFQEFKLNSNM